MFLGRVIGTGDPAWLDTDRGYALAWAGNKAATCNGCGTRADEWGDEDEDPYVPTSTMCRGCAQLAMGRANLAKDGEGRPLAGQYVYLEPTSAFLARMAAERRTLPSSND